MKTKQYTDPVLGAVTLRKSTRARRLSLRVHPRDGIIVTLPYFVRYAEGIRLLESRRDWVLQVQEKLRNRTESPQNSDIPKDPQALEAFVEHLRKQAKEDLPQRLDALAARYGFTYSGVTIKHNRSNWGSCSVRHHINLNLNLMRVPALLRDYVCLHELCHLRHMDHSEAFHTLLESLCSDNLRHYLEAGDEYSRAIAAHKGTLHKTLERELKSYRLA